MMCRIHCQKSGTPHRPTKTVFVPMPKSKKTVGPKQDGLVDLVFR